MRREIPRFLISHAEKERADENEDRAIVILRDSFEQLRPDLRKICFDLAVHHLSLSIDFAEDHLAEASRLAQIAERLEPGHDISKILDEIRESQAGRAIHVGIYDPNDPKWDESSNFHHVGAGAEARSIVDRLVNAGTRLTLNGQDVVAERVLRRAERIARVELGERDGRTIDAGLMRAQCLIMLGHRAVAATKAAALLPLAEKTFGPENPNTLAARYVEALSLHGNQDGDALAKVEGLLRTELRVLGPAHPHTLAAQYLEATILSQLDRDSEALTKLEMLVPHVREFFGNEHPHTLIAQAQEARSLFKLGRNDEALAKTMTVLAATERCFGQDNSRTLDVRLLEAEILAAMGQDSEALTRIEALVRTSETVRGPTHSDHLVARRVQSRFLAHAGRKSEAIANLRDILSLQIAREGADHVSARKTRELLEAMSFNGTRKVLRSGPRDIGI